MPEKRFYKPGDTVLYHNVARLVLETTTYQGVQKLILEGLPIGVYAYSLDRAEPVKKKITNDCEEN